MKILQAKNLTIQFQSEYEKVIAVNNISFHINKGETLGIVGESGSGKSVTALSIMRLINKQNGKINAGEIYFEEQDLLKLSEKQICFYRGSKISMIFQEPTTSLNPLYTCGKQVLETIQLHFHLTEKEAQKKTLSLFDEVQLKEVEKIFYSYPHELSGGQKQRVMIAMALSCNPAILIADEPTSSLDVTIQRNILDLLKKIKEERNMSILFISHDLAAVGIIADRMLIMQQGKIIEEGSTKKIFTNAQQPYTKGLIACRPIADRNLIKLPTIADFTHRPELSIEEVYQKLRLTNEQIQKRKNILQTPTPILEIKNLKMYYPVWNGIFGKKTSEVKAVDDVSFKLFPGMTLGLAGESGCGKTTLGKSIVKLVKPQNGEIIFQGINLLDINTEKSKELQKDIQIIFQDPFSSLNPSIKIGNAIMEALCFKQIFKNKLEKKQEAIKLLLRVGLKEEHFNRYPHEFSGGQKQRIAIARSLATKPKLIICDECVSALDVSLQAQIINLLSDLKEEFKLTYIFISHDLSVVKHISDWMIVMKNGKIVEEGDPDEMYKNPRSKYTQKLIQAIPEMPLPFME